MIVNMVTDKYSNMISAFQCDFSSARDGDMRLITLDKLIKENNPSLLYDIELLEELEMGLRYGRLAIVEVEETLEEQNSEKLSLDENIFIPFNFRAEKMIKVKIGDDKYK